MRQTLSATWAWLRVQFFRLWTAMAVLGAYVYLWFYKPEYLTWWKRSTGRLVEGGSSQLPYPWGDRLDDRKFWDLGPTDGSYPHLQINSRNSSPDDPNNAQKQTTSITTPARQAGGTEAAGRPEQDVLWHERYPT